MKINNDVSSTIRPTEMAPTKTTNAVAGKPAAAGAAIDSVRISDTSRSLQSAGASSTLAPFDAKRVEAIKAAISSGSFKVNADAVAGKLIDSVNQLLTGKA